MPQSKRKKRPVEFSSQRLPQIPAVRLGEGYAWIAGALSRYQHDFAAEHGVPLEMAQLVRKALAEVLSKTKRLDVESSRGDETFERIGPFRVTAAYPNLLDEIAAAAKRSSVNESDVIRSALAQWLTERGYDKPGERGKK
jgi:Arc/MetJ-type ribon-helix-helix transcriptional regulator